MARFCLQHRQAVIALLTVLAGSGLSACSSSSNQATSRSPQEEAAIQQQRYAGAIEIYNCARRHGVHLPTPTSAGVNVSGVKGRPNEVIVSNCYKKMLRKAQREQQAAREAGPQSLGEEPSR